MLGIFAEDVNSLLQWIVSGLYGGYVASNLLKWYWWRFNGHGYFWGMLAGLVPALIFPKAAIWPCFPDYIWPIPAIRFHCTCSRCCSCCRWSAA